MYRKLAITTLAGGVSLFGFLAGPAAHATPTCSNADGSPTTQASTSPGLPYDVQVCTHGTGVFDGTITAKGEVGTQQGYIIADGAPSNPRCLAGYYGYSTLGPDGNGPFLNLVGSSSGDYNDYSNPLNQTPNKALIDPSNPPKSVPC